MDDYETNRLLAHFSPKLTKEIEDYVSEVVLLGSRYIVTNRIGKTQYGKCTHCGNTFITEDLKHNGMSECIHCESMCQVKAGGLQHKNLKDFAYFVYFEKSEIDPEAICAKGISVLRDYSRGYTDVKTEYSLRVQYLFSSKETAMFEYNSYYGNWIIKKTVFSLFNQCSKYYMESNSNQCCSIESIKNAVGETKFQYCAYETYMKNNENIDMVKYFDLAARYPAVEYIVKIGFGELIHAKINGGRTYSAINWKGKNLFKVLKISKSDLKEIKQKSIDVSFEFLKMVHIARKIEPNASLEEIAQLVKTNGSEMDTLVDILGYVKAGPANRYLEKQRAFSKTKNMSTMYINHPRTYRDYLSDCNVLDMDMKDDHVLYPRDLYAAHQNTIKQVKFKGNELLNVKIKKRVGKLQELYSFSFGEYLVRPVESSEELIEEGKALHHCVGGYAERYANGKTNILLIREIKSPDKPFVTMEINNNRVGQVSGRYNEHPAEGVRKMIEEFKKMKLEKIGKSKKTKVSA